MFFTFLLLLISSINSQTFFDLVKKLMTNMILEKLQFFSTCFVYYIQFIIYCNCYLLNKSLLEILDMGRLPVWYT